MNSARSKVIGLSSSAVFVALVWIPATYHLNRLCSDVEETSFETLHPFLYRVLEYVAFVVNFPMWCFCGLAGRHTPPLYFLYFLNGLFWWLVMVWIYLVLRDHAPTFSFKSKRTGHVNPPAA